jgi:hypothetical protein
MSDRTRLVEPKSVRFWYGSKTPLLSWLDFCGRLGEILIPATAQFQANLGLTAYVLSVLPEEKPLHVPDEIALVFYESQEVYKSTFKTTGGRAYGLLHRAIFDFSGVGSFSSFPQLFTGDLMVDCPYYLFDTSCDWQNGSTRVLVGVPKSFQSFSEFKWIISQFLNGLIDNKPEGLENAYAIVSSDFIAYWEHWIDHKTGSQLQYLNEIVDPVLIKDASNVHIDTKWNDIYQGIKVKGGDCLNILFQRREK